MNRVRSLATQVKSQEIFISQKEQPTNDDYRLLRELKVEYHNQTAEQANKNYSDNEA